MQNRRIHQLRQAGSDDVEGPSVGDPPRAPSAPDLGPAPLHLARDGQIVHLRSARRRSSRLASPPPVFCTPVTSPPPPTPEEATAGRRRTCSPAAPSKTTPRRGGCRAPKRRRRPPHRNRATLKPLTYTPERRSGDSPSSRRRSGRRRVRNPPDTPAAAGRARVASDSPLGTVERGGGSRNRRVLSSAPHCRPSPYYTVIQLLWHNS